MKLYFATKPQAQAKADSVHAWLLANNPAYSASATAKQTVRWDVPHQDLDADGNAIGTQWYVNVETKCMGSLSVAEAAAVV